LILNIKRFRKAKEKLIDLNFSEYIILFGVSMCFFISLV